MLRRSIVVPLYQESGRIESTVRRLAGSPLHEHGTEFVFVDDGSTDGTVDVLHKAVADAGLQQAQVLRLPGNRGKGAAVRTGILASRGQVVAFVDADLSSPPSAILQCLEAVERGTQVAVASRAHPTSDITVRQPSGRESAGKTFNRLIRLLGLTSLPDTQCGLKAFDRASARRLFLPLTIRRFAFDVEVLARAADLGLRVEVIPTEWAHVEQSRVSPLRDGARMAWDAARVARARRRVARAHGPAETSPGAVSRAPSEVTGRIERTPWWLAGQRELVRRHVEAAVEPPHRGSALDVGCGTGSLVADLHAAGFRLVLGCDVDQDALRRAARGLPPGALVVRADAARLPVPEGSVDLLAGLDVVEHLDDDVSALTEYLRALRPGGHLVLTVPAHASGWISHGLRLAERRRYTRPQLEEALAAAGFADVQVRYFHSCVVPQAGALRWTARRRAAPADDSGGLGGRWQTALGHALVRADLALELPFGLSIFASARRPA